MTSAAYGYYPGCSMRGIGVAYEESLLTLFRLLGLSLEELRDWNCCGATSYMCIDENLAFLLSAGNLALAHQNGFRELVTPCSACYLCLRKVQDYVERYPEVAERVRDSLAAASLPPLNSVTVRHPLEVLFTDSLESCRISVLVSDLQVAPLRRWHPVPPPPVGEGGFSITGRRIADIRTAIAAGGAGSSLADEIEIAVGRGEHQNLSKHFGPCRFTNFGPGI